MKGNVLGALLVSVCLTGQSFGAGLMDRMLGNGCGCDSCEASCCCEKSCGCPDDCCGDDACCEPACGCEDTCCDNGCGRRCCILDRLFGGRKHSCCEASCGCDDGCCGDDACCEEASCGCPDDCCEDACCDNGCGKRRCCLLGLFSRKNKCCEASCGCDDGCCGDDACCEEASCGCPDDCCADSCCDNGCGKRRCCLLGRLFGRKHNCCEASCGCNDDCCEASCGCASNGGCSSCAPAADAPAGGEASPIPPAPVADPAAKVGMPRKVVSASFVR